MRPAERPFTVGNVLAGSFTLYRRFLGRFVVVSFAVFGPIGGLSLLLTLSSSDVVRYGGLALVTLLFVLGCFWVQALLAVQVDAVRAGETELPMRRNIDRTRPFATRLIALALVIAPALGVFLAAMLVLAWQAGIFLLGVPVVLVVVLAGAVRLAVVCPALIVEDLAPLDAIRRSNQLLEGHRWRTFWLLVITTLLSFVIIAVVGALVRQALHGAGAEWVTGIAGDALAAPFAGLAVAVSYFSLRVAGPASVPAGAAFQE